MDLPYAFDTKINFTTRITMNNDKHRMPMIDIHRMRMKTFLFKIYI
jgi:hypothetical protein